MVIGFSVWSEEIGWTIALGCEASRLRTCVGDDSERACVFGKDAYKNSNSIKGAHEQRNPSERALVNHAPRGIVSNVL